MRIAIVGCGQLSRMMALAGLPLGIQFSFIHDDKSQNRDCVQGLGIIEYSPDKIKSTNSYDTKAIAQLYQALGQPDCISVEKEQVDLALLQALADFCPIYPCVAAIKACQHRGEEKQLLTDLAIPTSPYFYNNGAKQAVQTLGYPVMAKSCTEGYDGKNQWLIKTPSDAVQFDKLQIEDYIIEKFIEFDKEISLISVRSQSGQIKHYSLTENHHQQGMLTHSIAPALNIPDSVKLQAQHYMESLLNQLEYVGILAIEFFVVGDSLMVNELAPRVHNSGHWTQLGSITCQFENHIRALAGLNLGSTEQIAVTGMFNLIGTKQPPFDALTQNSKLYWYNKAPKAKRKLGHINFIAENQQLVKQQMIQLADANLSLTVHH
ncbi:5-(carboxyamino)imidazole ribonucleotide synthase [Psychromonas ingrahamii 37]|uniref:N5-carboxyaminoimidazole ribonucleotide synthase n=1 Tax=Psychromonas ingrahamii (strain DSM 17664 / CCUG 51855 / 37) TaxID=357804 RepID=A1SWD9_PSYIN|nr:5-(carboxyamino)imidazole ribonucleotide synthase [Psychromonas ingrahamii]ABM03804.1 5-(carboxyamino)imidazole ribonucleotide synthase [Psychromonas ingrahamii 37]